MVTITFDGNEQYTGFGTNWQFSNILFGWDYDVHIEHADYATLDATVDFVNSNSSYTVVMGESITLDIDKTEIANDNLIIYPNPVNDILFIQTDAKISLFDLTGKELITIDNNSQVKEIKMNQYPAGIYLIKAYTEDGIQSKKIININ